MAKTCKKEKGKKTKEGDVMPKKYKRALSKAWRGLTPKERAHMELQLVEAGSVTTGVAGSVGLALLSPTMAIALSPILATVVGGGLYFLIREGGVTGRIAKKFARLFHKHHGEPLHRVTKRIERQVAHKKLRKVM